MVWFEMKWSCIVHIPLPHFSEAAVWEHVQVVLQLARLDGLLVPLLLVRPPEHDVVLHWEEGNENFMVDGSIFLTVWNKFESFKVWIFLKSFKWKTENCCFILPDALSSQGCWGRTAYLEYFSTESSSLSPEVWNISFSMAESREVFPLPEGPGLFSLLLRLMIFLFCHPYQWWQSVLRWEWPGSGCAARLVLPSSMRRMLLWSGGCGSAPPQSPPPPCPRPPAPAPRQPRTVPRSPDWSRFLSPLVCPEMP